MRRVAVVLIEENGREVAHEVGRELVIGRGEGARVRILDGRVSKLHAIVRPEAGGWVIEDQQTRNGTRVNGRPITRAALTGGEEIGVGPARLRFVIRTESRVPPAGERILESVMIVPHQAAPHERDIGDEAALRREYELLRTMQSLSARLGEGRDLRESLQEVLRFCLEELPADSGVVLLTNAHGEYVPQLAYPEDAGPTVSRSVLERVSAQREAVLIGNRASHMSLMAAESLMGVRSLLAVPFVVGDAVPGVIVLENERLAEPFTPRHLELLVGIAGQVSLLIERSQLLKQVRQEAIARANFARFLAPALVKQVQANEIDLGPGGRLTDIVVLFSDIRGFTSMSERLGAEATVALLNSYLTTMVDSVFAHGGTLDKFIGDAVMATWGAPVPTPNDRERALACALDMIERLETFNDAAPEGQEKIAIGIGLCAGPAVVGFIGSPKRLEYTSIGDTVNTASRLCNEAGADEVIVHESVVGGLGPEFRLEALEPVSVKGKAKPLITYRVRRG